MTNDPRTALALLDHAHRHWTGQPLPRPPGLAADAALDWLHQQAPYSLLAHGVEQDPLFFYANACALRCFGYPRQAFYGMPSRLSASPKDRDARQVLMETVRDKGFAADYTGWRVDHQGNPFMIYAGSVWNLLDAQGQRVGQAALFWPDAARVGVLI